VPTSAISAGQLAWPALIYEDWKDTQSTLHMWTQIVGKIRLVQAPWTNHSWHVPFYVTSRGLTTSPIPYGTRTFEILFDFVAHELRIETDAGAVERLQLTARPVADFYAEVFGRLGALGLDIRILPMPCEIPNAVPLDQDRQHRSYDPEQASRFWRVLLQSDRVLKEFRSRFLGKCSPVHFFWGGFDLAVTRFSGRPAPTHPGGVPNLPDWVAREAYSHEVSSCGFWPGAEALPQPVFYAYAYPEPKSFKGASIRPAAARYHAELREFLLAYDEVRRAASPDATLLDFLQTTYEAAADGGGWDRAALEWQGAPTQTGQPIGRDG
jgi:hypothetical protein